MSTAWTRGSESKIQELGKTRERGARHIGVAVSIADVEKKRNEPCGAWRREAARRKFFFLTERDLVRCNGRKKKRSIGEGGPWAKRAEEVRNALVSKVRDLDIVRKIPS